MLIRITGNQVTRVTSGMPIHKDSSTHVVPRSGLKRLGYNEEQRARIREIRAELKD